MISKCGGSEVRINSCRESEMRTSEPEPYSINKLLVSLLIPKFANEVPQNDANFGIGTLVFGCYIA